MAKLSCPKCGATFPENQFTCVGTHVYDVEADIEGLPVQGHYIDSYDGDDVSYKEYHCCSCGHEFNEFKETKSVELLTPGTPVLYVKGDNSGHVELGIIKRRNHTDDGYFVRYHTGATSANTPDYLITPIANDYAFQIIRKDVNEDIQSQKARQIAHKIIQEIIEPLVGEGIEGTEYYNCEDTITKIIEEYKEE